MARITLREVATEACELKRVIRELQEAQDLVGESIQNTPHTPRCRVIKEDLDHVWDMLEDLIYRIDNVKDNITDPRYTGMVERCR